MSDRVKDTLWAALTGVSIVLAALTAGLGGYALGEALRGCLR